MSIAVANWVSTGILVLYIVFLEFHYPLVRPAIRRWRYRAAERRDDRLYGPRNAAAIGAHRPIPPIPIDTARMRHRRL